jgi:PKD repeat protein
MKPIWLAAVLAGAGLTTACKDSKGPDGSIGPINEAPAAAFAAPRCTVNVACSFTDASTDDSGIASWGWSFGDAGSSAQRNPSHTYTSAGTYTVSLTVTDQEGETSPVSHDVVAAMPAITSLTCVDGAAPGGYVGCTLRLEQEAGFKVVLNSRSCEAHGNIFRITAPVQQTLTNDGCYAQVGTQLTSAGAFAAGTEISAEVVAPLLANPPALRVSGSYPEWVLTYEDGVDQDFDDLVMTLTALPTGN